MTMSGGGKQIHFSELRVLYFGMSGLLSRIPLAKLLDAKVNICGIVLPSSVLPPYLHPENGRFQTHIPQNNQSFLLTPYPDLLQLAAQHQIPVTAVSQLRHPETITALKKCSPDLICVSCFDQKFPKTLLTMPALGCINLHPSLLPQFRGPSPLFWTFQQGIQQTGVTLHLMDMQLDTGDILLQATQTIADGISGNEAEVTLAELGATLLLKAVTEYSSLLPYPQSGTSSYFPYPTAADFALDLNWSAQRAFNFMRGTAEWQMPYLLHQGDNTVLLHTAVSLQYDAQQTTTIQREGDLLSIQFKDGLLLASPHV